MAKSSQSDKFVGFVSEFVYQKTDRVLFTLVDANGNEVIPSILVSGFQINPLTFAANVVLTARANSLEVEVKADTNGLVSEVGIVK